MQDPRSITQSSQSAIPDAAPRVKRAQVRRLSHRQLHVAIEFDRAVLEQTWAEISLGYLCLHAKDSRAFTLAISMPTALWNPGWQIRIPQPDWSEDMRGFSLNVMLPEKFERIPDAPEVLCEPPADRPWPFMTDAEWRERTEPWG